MKLDLNNQVVKGAIIILLTSLMSIVTNIPSTSTQWLMFAFVTIGTLAGYFAQSAIFPSTSQGGQLNWKDVLKGLLVSISNGVSTWAATFVDGEPVKWGALGISMAGLFLGYLLKQFNTTPPKD